MFNPRYDLTGADNQFKQEDTVRVFTPRQTYELVAPAYQESIQVKWVDGTGAEHPLSPAASDDDEGWSVAERDLTAMAVAKNKVPTGTTFNKELVKTIQINLVTDATDSNEYLVKISYQRLTLDLPEYMTPSGDGPAYSRTLGRFILDKLDALETQFSGIKAANIFGSSSTENDFLDEDLTGASAANYVQNETHAVDSSRGRIMIAPAKGSFYPSDLVVARYQTVVVTLRNTLEAKSEYIGNLFFYNDTVTGDEKSVVLSESNYDTYKGKTGKLVYISSTSSPTYEVLQLGVDYEVCNINLAKTERSFAEEGVYDNIRFINPNGITGTVLISYRAFGGTVDVASARSVRKDLSNVQEVLANTSFLSSDNLGKDPTVQEIRGRISKLEDFYGSFYQVEHQVSTNMTGFQWFNIAEIYDLDYRGKGFPRYEVGAIDEVGHFRVESKMRNWCYEFMINLDLTKTNPRDMLKVKTLGATNSQPISFTDYIRLTETENVAVRVVFAGDGSQSGVILQLGWDFSKYGNMAMQGDDTDSIIVTNKSGSTSKWRLYCDPQNFMYTELDAHRVIDHVVLKAATSLKATDVYYRMVNDYVYYTTQDAYVLPNKAYFRVTYNPTTAAAEYTQYRVAVGTEVASIGQSLFERSLLRKRRLLQVITDIHSTSVSGLYTIDPAASTNTAATVLPNDVAWNASTGEFLSSMLEPEGGLIGWVGNVPLNQLTPRPEGAGSSLRTQMVLPTDVLNVLQIYNIKSVTVDIYDRKDDKFRSKTIEVSDSGTSTTTEGEDFFFLADLCALRVTISRVQNSGAAIPTFNVDLRASLGTQSIINNRFDLRQIRLHF